MSRTDDVLAWLRVLDGDRVASSGVGMPCCTMVALWLLAVRLGVVPDGVVTYDHAKDWGARCVVSRGWWQRANVWDPRSPWSALTAAEELTGGRYVAHRLVSTSMPAPELTPGRWHVIQRWRDPGRVLGGHTYLVWAPLDDGDVVVVQSSEAKRLRVSPGSWDGTAGLVGYSVGAVVLPAGTP